MVLPYSISLFLQIQECEKTEKKTAKRKKKTKKSKNSENKTDDKKALLSESITVDDSPGDRNHGSSDTLVSHEGDQNRPSDLNLDSSMWPKPPKRLATGIPDLVANVDDAIDDEENDLDNQLAMTIGEAFAEEDVITEFQ